MIGGSKRGRPLRAPRGSQTRPTSDRVREAMFDMLASRIDLNGLVVVDLFAGSGALGIEALSRGAHSAVFVERSSTALPAIRANLVATGLDGSRSEVFRGDAMGFVLRDRRFDVAFVDPPYSFGDWARLLGHLKASLVVLESSTPVELPAGWDSLRCKRYGGTLVGLAESVVPSDVPQRHCCFPGELPGSAGAFVEPRCPHAQSRNPQKKGIS